MIYYRQVNKTGQCSPHSAIHPLLLRWIAPLNNKHVNCQSQYLPFLTIIMAITITIIKAIIIYNKSSSTITITIIMVIKSSSTIRHILTFSLQTSSHSRLNIAGFSSVTSICTWWIILTSPGFFAPDNKDTLHITLYTIHYTLMDSRMVSSRWRFSRISPVALLLLQVAYWASLEKWCWKFRGKSNYEKVEVRLTVPDLSEFIVCCIEKYIKSQLHSLSMKWVVSCSFLSHVGQVGRVGHQCYWSDRLTQLCGFRRCLVFKNMPALPLI